MEDREYRTLDDKIVGRLKAERLRTGVGHVTLFEKLRRNDPSWPKGLTVEDICRIFSGNADRLTEEHLRYIEASYSALRDKRVPASSDDLACFTLSKNDTAALRQEQERTQVSPHALLKRFAHDLKRPEGLNGYKIYRWMDGQTQSAHRDEYEYVRSKYRMLQDAVGRRVMLSEEIIDQLGRLRQETGVSPSALLKHAEEQEINVPAGLNVDIIRSWIRGDVRTARSDYLAFVTNAYQKVLEGE